MLPEKQNPHRMTPTNGRSRTTSETNTTNGQATVNSTGHAEDCRLEVTILDEGVDGGRLPDVVAQSKIYDVTENEPLESYLAITIQVFIPFLIAGLGMVGAGLVLDLVQVRLFTLSSLSRSTLGHIEILRNKMVDCGVA